MFSQWISSVLGFGFSPYPSGSLYSSTYSAWIVHPRVDDFMWLTTTLGRGLEQPRSIDFRYVPFRPNDQQNWNFHAFYTYLLVTVTEFHGLEFDLVGPHKPNKTSTKKSWIWRQFWTFRNWRPNSLATQRTRRRQIQWDFYGDFSVFNTGFHGDLMLIHIRICMGIQIMEKVEMGIFYGYVELQKGCVLGLKPPTTKNCSISLIIPISVGSYLG